MARTLDPKRLRALEERYGALIARHDARAGERDLSRYRQDPVGFAREVLKDEPWAKQVEMMEAVRDRDRVAVRGSNSAGKDHAAAALALWWAYTRPGSIVLVTGPTQRQVDEIVFGRELRRLWARSGLPGELLVHALRTGDGAVAADGSLAAGILGFVSTDLSKLTGHHAPHVMCVVTEAQGVDDMAIDAMFNNATGPEDRLLLVANPTEPVGRFYRACQPRSGWWPIRIPAREHPNIVEGRQVIPGGPSPEWLARVRTEHGEGSRFWRTFVDAEFPDIASDALVAPEWLDRAEARWGGGRMQDANAHEPVVGLDVARTGGDLCVAYPVRGPVVYAPDCWEPDPANPTRDAADRAAAVMRRHGGRPEWEPGETVGVHGSGRRARGRFAVDEALMGGGVIDLLRERGWEVADWNGARRPDERCSEPARFENMRAAGYWWLRAAFQAGVPVMAPCQETREDLLATRYTAGPTDKTKIARKPEIKAALGRSPDRGDALMMAWAEANGEGGEAAGAAVVTI